MSAAARRNRKAVRSYALGYRLSWLFALQALISLGAVCAAIYVVMSLLLANRERDELEAKAELMRHVLATTRQADVPAMRHELDDILIGHGDLKIVLLDAAGQVVYRSPIPRTWSGRFRETALSLRWADGGGQFVRVGIQMDTASNQRVLQGLAWVLVCATLLGAGAVSLGGFWIVRVGLAPLRELARQTRALTPDRLDQRLTSSGHAEELQPWIAQLNDLLARLQGAYQQLEGFNADVAHELRTPLATLISRSELDLAQERSNEQLRDSIASNLEELQRLAAIIKDMLFLSQADRGASARLDPPDSLAQQVAEVVEFHEAVLDEAKLHVAIEGDAILPFDRRLLRRALSNLVGNASRYAEPGSTITAMIREGLDGWVSIGIGNRGPTIPAESLPRLFDRFYRVETARVCGTVNHGLGLAIVAAIARMHGGRTFARSAGGETVIGLALPKTST